MGVEVFSGSAWKVAADLTPAGAIVAFGGSAAPVGWLLCDGAAVSRTTYDALFSAIGTAFGTGDGSTTFNLPNFKGVSPTGVGSQDINGRTKTGPALGEVREDQMQGHYHGPLSPAADFRQGGSPSESAFSTGSSGRIESNTGEPVTDGTNGTPRTWAYTHGPELGVNFIIKF